MIKKIGIWRLGESSRLVFPYIREGISEAIRRLEKEKGSPDPISNGEIG